MTCNATTLAGLSHLLLLGVALLASQTGCGEKPPVGAAPTQASRAPPWAKVAPEQIAEAKKDGVPVAFENKFGMRFVLIPAGTFMMGAQQNNPAKPNYDLSAEPEESPVHAVTLAAFYLATTETTQAAWEDVRGAHRSAERGGALPVTGVSWEDCQGFIEQLDKSGAGEGYRLPTEAEWEYACRAGTTTPWWTGDDPQDLLRAAWYAGSSSDDRCTHPVGQKAANPFGLYDTHGNVFEWCEDTYSDTYKGAPGDGGARVEEGPRFRVARSGSWGNIVWETRSSRRAWFAPTHRDPSIGFRVARSVVSE